MTRLGVSGSGYETARDPDTGEFVYVHRLAAVAEHGFDAVVDADVHHLDGNPWMNAPENLQPLPAGDHRGMNLPNTHRASD